MDLSSILIALPQCLPAWVCFVCVCVCVCVVGQSGKCVGGLSGYLATPYHVTARCGGGRRANYSQIIVVFIGTIMR